MKHYSGPVFALLTFALLTSASALAQNREKVVIALETDDFKLAETDISTLTVGEAQTIETDSGRVIDILRTSDGAEIYVDGELLEMNFNDEGLHEEHMMNKHVEIVCDNGEECDENIIIINHDEHEASGWATEDGEHVVIHREVEVTCNDNEEGDHCSHPMVLISESEPKILINAWARSPTEQEGALRTKISPCFPFFNANPTRLIASFRGRRNRVIPGSVTVRGFFSLISFIKRGITEPRENKTFP